MHDSREMARNAPGMSIRDDSPMIDMGAMRSFRLGRLQAEIVAADCAAGVFFGPINVRYATGTKNAVISSMHSPFRCAVVPPEGGVTLFSWGRGEWCPETVAEVRPMPVFNYFPTGARGAHRLKEWVGQMRELVEGDRIALDVAPPEAVQALERAGFEVIPGQPIKEHAAVIKSDEEIACMVHACTVAETAMARMRAALEPGMSENDLYAVLHHTNIAMGGEWIEYRLLASGGHINRWTVVEAGDKIIRPGELVAFDCGLVGPFGYSADVSRTFLCEPGPSHRGAAHPLSARPREHPAQPRAGEGGCELSRALGAKLDAAGRVHRPSLPDDGARHRHGRRMAVDSLAHRLGGGGVRRRAAGESGALHRVVHRLRARR